jgi:hypothetical protein
MPTALFAGLPQRSLARLKAILASAETIMPDWTFRFWVTQKSAPDLQIRDRKAIHAEAEKIGALHVLGLSTSDNRSEVAEAIRPFFRFRWFDNVLLHKLNSPDPTEFIEATRLVLQEEQDWENRVMPIDVSDALILPESCFGCSAALKTMWQKAQAYGSEDSVPAAERAITAFKREYYRRIEFKPRGQAPRQQSKWVDSRNLVFDESGARHGIAPVPRDWKLSHRLETGFHFDISKHNNDRFVIQDREGIPHRIEKRGYINIDAHGYFRGEEEVEGDLP